MIGLPGTQERGVRKARDRWKLEFEVSLPLLAQATFHGNATTYSWLIGSLGAGAAAGGLYAARAARTGVARLTRTAPGTPTQTD